MALSRQLEGLTGRPRPVYLAHVAGTRARVRAAHALPAHLDDEAAGRVVPMALQRDRAIAARPIRVAPVPFVLPVEVEDGLSIGTASARRGVEVPVEREVKPRSAGGDAIDH